MNGYADASYENISKWRILLPFFLLLLLSGGYLIRAVWLIIQDVKPPRPVRVGVRIRTPRGEILGRDGIPLVTNRGVLQVFLYRNHLSQQKLLKLGLPVRKVVQDRLTFVGEIPYSREREAFLRDIPGVRVVYGYQRFHTYGPAVIPVVGHLRKDGVGGSGVELWLDSVLTSEKGYEVVFVRQQGSREVLSLPFYPSHKGRPGKSVRLTLRPDFSDHLYNLLDDYVQTVQAERGAILVLDPNTGDILTWVEVPPQRGTLRFLTAPYEPGSVMKVGTYIAALENGMHLSDMVTVPRKVWRIQNHLFRESSDSAVGKLTLKRAIVWSSNIAAAKTAFRVGKKRLYKTLRQIGIGTPTGISFPGEDPGQIRPYTEWDSVDVASVAIGQGYLVNALQVALIYAAVANGGTLLIPRLIAQVGDHPTSPPPPVRTIAPSGTIRALQHAFIKVVEEGTGKRARIEGMVVAGKTGTAQKVDPETGQYSFSRLLVSFIGYFPADNPQYVVYVLIDEPKRGRSGGAVAAPLFREVAQWIWYHTTWEKRWTQVLP